MTKMKNCTEIPHGLKSLPGKSETWRHFPHGRPIQNFVNYLNQQKIQKIAIPFCTRNQIEHSLSYASFAIVKKDNIRDRIEILVCTPFFNLIIPYLIPDTIPILMLILVHLVHV